MNEPVRMVPRHEEVKDAPALGMSLQVDLGMGRIATLQTFVPSDASQRDLNTMLDKMTRAGDRQRAHYKLEELNRDLLEEQRKHAQMEEDIATAKASFSAEQEKRLAAVQKQEKVVANFEAAKRAERGANRRGEVELKGADAANVATLTNAVKAMKDDIVAADLQYPVDCANREASLATHAKAIARIEREIARCKEIEKAGLEG